MVQSQPGGEPRVTSGSRTRALRSARSQCVMLKSLRKQRLLMFFPQLSAAGCCQRHTVTLARYFSNAALQRLGKSAVNRGSLRWGCTSPVLRLYG